ncbi:MAG: lipoyl(octanoyl) transferase LipB [Prevotellaceae bacterium]|jgi:lipoyl(octanoyl) transferase|nr:lipoyl(octanoyl) transferase LipB [Prevotellaceae bacterium]
MSQTPFTVQFWGEIDYLSAWNRQTVLFEEQIALKSSGLPTTNTLILCSHPHVYTLGKNGQAANMLLDDGSVPLIRTNRGGDITYHGPGQIVGYPVFDLETFHLGLKNYIAKVEAAIIRVLDDYGITGDRQAGATGVWLTDNSGTRKICAIGVRGSHYITMHGFALNVNTDLSYFQRINPCGFIDKGVTSMQAELGHLIPLDAVREQLVHAFEQTFSR